MSIKKDLAPRATTRDRPCTWSLLFVKDYIFIEINLSLSKMIRWGDTSWSPFYRRQPPVESHLPDRLRMEYNKKIKSDFRWKVRK
jgi:hypothetical protein